MKTVYKLVLFLGIVTSMQSCICIFGDCDEKPLPPPIDQYIPVLLDRATFESSIQMQPAQSVDASGKIYIKDHLMFVNDVNKGFHVYDYTNPSTPVKLSFIKILGATDLAIRDNNIYINQAVDLVTLNYNSANNSIQVLHRNKNVFPQKISPIGTTAYQSNENNIVINWVKNYNYGAIKE